MIIDLEIAQSIGRGIRFNAIQRQRYMKFKEIFPEYLENNNINEQLESSSFVTFDPKYYLIDFDYSSLYHTNFNNLFKNCTNITDLPLLIDFEPEPISKIRMSKLKEILE